MRESGRLLYAANAHRRFRLHDGGRLKFICSLSSPTSSLSPEPAPCPRDERPISYNICADDTFPLQENLMKPYSYKDMQIERRVFNYRISRARTVVENAFGIMANKFRVFHMCIGLGSTKV